MKKELLRELFSSLCEPQNEGAKPLMMAKEYVQKPPSETKETPEEKTNASIESVLKYHRGEGESVQEYLRRNHADLFLAWILAEGVTDDREILEATRKGYRDMWNGSKSYRGGRYYNAPEVKRQHERIIAVLDGACKFSA